MKSYSFLNAIVLVILSGSLGIAPAYSQSGDSWEYSGAINLWGAGIQGTTATGADIDVSLSDILDNLDFTLMGTLEARKSRWSLIGDVVYLGVSADNSAKVTTPGGAVDSKVDVDVDGWVLNFLAGYNFSETDKGRHDVVFGTRYLDMDTKLNLNLAGVGNNASIQDDVWDGVVGVRGRVNLQNNWYLQYYLDVGTGQSDYTWQALAGAGYKFGWGDLTFAYRHLEWEFDSGSALQDINFSGPGIQAKWYF